MNKHDVHLASLYKKLAHYFNRYLLCQCSGGKILLILLNLEIMNSSEATESSWIQKTYFCCQIYSQIAWSAKWSLCKIKKMSSELEILIHARNILIN